jgi:adenosylmethionine-8-amino-7-oxononanoate aminotransferase
MELANRLADLAPMDNAKVFFVPGGGSDSVDTAAKLVRRYWSLMGRHDKRVIVSRTGGYHGMNGYGTSLCGIPPNLEGYNGPIIDEVHVVDRNSVDEIRELFERSGDSIAAFIGEPVIGAGGVYPPEPDYWPQIERLCREHDVLLICDEVICAFGRLGAWFGCQVYGFTPDLITCAKGLTSGYLPLGAVITSGEFAAPFWDDPDAPVLRHGYTYSGHPAACVAALANLDIIEREGLVERVAELAPWYAELIHATFDDLDIVAEARAVGLLAAVEIRGDLVAADPGLPLRVTAECRNQGLISRAIGASLQISPSLVATKEEITAMIDRLKAALDIVAADLVLAGDQA